MLNIHNLGDKILNFQKLKGPIPQSNDRVAKMLKIQALADKMLKI